MKTGCTSGKKKQGFSFNSVCTVFEPFKMGHFNRHRLSGIYIITKGFHMKNPTYLQ